jgi:hypothetical protein
MKLTETTDPVARRLACWFGLAVLLILACACAGVAFPIQAAGVDLLAARLALLGLIGAIATFQYGVWMRVASVAPFVDAWWRYAGGLSAEFKAWAKAFGEQA